MRLLAALLIVIAVSFADGKPAGGKDAAKSKRQIIYGYDGFEGLIGGSGLDESFGFGTIGEGLGNYGFDGQVPQIYPDSYPGLIGGPYPTVTKHDPILYSLIHYQLPQENPPKVHTKVVFTIPGNFDTISTINSINSAAQLLNAEEVSLETFVSDVSKNKSSNSTDSNEKGVDILSRLATSDVDETSKDATTIIADKLADEEKSTESSEKNDSDKPMVPDLPPNLLDVLNEVSDTSAAPP